MFGWRRKDEWLQLVRYYAAGVVNLAFGYVLFAILITLGMQVYAAQALGYILGVLFNYLTYSRFAFAGQKANKTNFVASYVANYLVSLGLLWLTLTVIPDPLVAGLVVTIAASLVNYLVLKRLVFRLSAGT
jgi:putative flippase GtrA